MKLTRYLTTAALVAGLGACSASPAVSIAATGTGLAAAQNIALKYVTLPVCPTGKSTMPDGTFCQDTTITANIKKASADATSGYDAAALNPTSATAALAAAALATLTAITTTVAVPAN